MKKRINWKRVAMFGVPLFLFAVLAVAGIFGATGAHAAAPTMNVHAPKHPAAKEVTVMGTIARIKGDTLIIRDYQDRGQTLVQLDRNTKIVSKGMDRKDSVRDLKVGEFVQVTGTLNKNSAAHTILAKQVVVSKAPARSRS